MGVLAFWIAALIAGFAWFSNGIMVDYKAELAQCVQRGGTWARAFGRGLSEQEQALLVRSARYECLIEKRIHPETLEPMHGVRRMMVAAALNFDEWLDHNLPSEKATAPPENRSQGLEKYLEHYPSAPTTSQRP